MRTNPSFDFGFVQLIPGEERMFKREITPELVDLAKKMPVVALLGPRQSGKTTLAKATFPQHIYVSLEEPDKREFARKDPRAFIAHYMNEHGIIVDEVQLVPELPSYIQTYVDADKKNGRFVLTGSQNFLLLQTISQSLAGRIALFTLLPLSVPELKKATLLPDTPEELIFKGLYPRIYAEKDLEALKWFPNYINTYLERDVRQIINVTDLSQFQLFVKLCAGRIGQLVNLTSLGNDCGISDVTAQKWLTVLEASYILFFLQPHYKNFSRRLVKTPKLYFYDTGLACSLLGIESAQQLTSHYLKGGLFESFVISELSKQRYNQGLRPHLYFWRDKTGHEVDCIIERGDTLIPVEIKAGKTLMSSFFTELTYWNELTGGEPKNTFLVYGGTENQQRSPGNAIGWDSIDMIMDKAE